jgi:hypothetical protein
MRADMRVNDPGLGLQASRFCRTIYGFVPSQRMDTAPAHDASRAGEIFSHRRFVMRRVTALCAAFGIAASAFAVAGAAQAGYYVIRWDNTGICQIWNEDLTHKPMQWLSDYKVVSKPVPTLSDAMVVQEKMRQQRHCTL